MSFPYDIREHMGKRQKEWARRARVAVIEQLGGVCKRCGGTEPLELDCILPMGHKHHKYEPSHRMSFYRQQLQAGNLQLLCEHCHAVKTASDTLRDLLSTDPISVKVP